MTDDALRGLFAALEEKPDDAVALAALADWFEEHDDEGAAACVRWALRRRLRPGRNPHQTTFGKYFWEREGPEPILDDPRARLAEALWQAVGDNDEPHPVGSFKSYRTAEAAYRALVAGWKRIGGMADGRSR
jgi:hypothetical protein